MITMNRSLRIMSTHKEECNCESCHEFHVENDNVFENSARRDYGCCREEIEFWAQKKIWCKECETGCYMDDGKCLECETTKKKRIEVDSAA